jgi:GMP synthase (glutamine-hydrolysing)
LSGGKGNPFEPLNLTSNFIVLMNFDVPILGFCLGHEIIAAAYGGRIRKLPQPRTKKEHVKILNREDPICEGLDKEEVFLTKQHSFYVSKLPSSFIRLGESETCENEIIRHEEKPIYGFQAHPEVSGRDGIIFIKNFLRICGIID